MIPSCLYSLKKWANELHYFFLCTPIHLLNIILLVCQDSVQLPLRRAKDGKDEINARRNIKSSRGNHKQIRPFTWGKHKGILAGFKSRGCLGGEEYHHPVQILPHCRWSRINPSACWSPFAISFPHRQRRSSMPRLPRFVEDLHASKDQREKENTPSASASPPAEEALAPL